MKVKELKEALSYVHPEAEVGFATDSEGGLDLLSCYCNHNDPMKATEFWFDLEVGESPSIQ